MSGKLKFSLILCLIGVLTHGLTSCEKEDSYDPNAYSGGSIDGSRHWDITGEVWVLEKYTKDKMNVVMVPNDTIRFITDNTALWNSTPCSYSSTEWYGHYDPCFINFFGTPYGLLVAQAPITHAHVNMISGNRVRYGFYSDSCLGYLWLRRL